MKKLLLAATLLLFVYSVNAQRLEAGFKLGGLVNYDPAFVNGVVPNTGFVLLFRPNNGMFQFGPVAEMGIDNGDAVLALGPDFNVPINLGRIGYIYPGISLRIMSAYNDLAYSAGMHAGLNLKIANRMSLNLEAGPRIIYFDGRPGVIYYDGVPSSSTNYIVGSGSVGLRFGL